MRPISMLHFAPRLSLEYFDKRLHLKQLSLTPAESGCYVNVSRLVTRCVQFCHPFFPFPVTSHAVEILLRKCA